MMNKKIMLLALAAVSAAVLALPVMASALTPLHLTPVPVGAKTIDDVNAFNPTLSTSSGTTIECGKFSGSTTFTTGTTGTMQLTFSEHCHVNGFGGETCNSGTNTNGTITTTVLPFDLATLPNNKPGVLVTPASGNHFATFVCKVFGISATTVVSGNGVIGTITTPACGASSANPVIKFSTTKHGFQEHTTLAGTATEYDLKKGEETAAQTGEGKITLGTETQL